VLAAVAAAGRARFRPGVAAADDDDVVGFGVSDGGHWGVSFGFQAAFLSSQGSLKIKNHSVSDA